jgi:hypothetical protein
VSSARAGSPELLSFRLPVAGRNITLRTPTGAEDFLLLETGGGETGVALALVSRLAQPATGEEFDWSELTVCDLDFVIVRLRQAVVGDRIRADVACQAGGCGRRIDISFGLGEYLEQRRPAQRRAARPADESGWFEWTSARQRTREEHATILFRLPTAADQLAVADSPRAVDELARRCLRPANLPARLRRQVEATMEEMAPSLSSDLRGVCPECGAEMEVFFDARQFCLRELRDRAAFIYQDIDLLARRYHWSETEILSLPQTRRASYAELARQEGGGW